MGRRGHKRSTTSMFLRAGASWGVACPGVFTGAWAHWSQSAQASLQHSRMTAFSSTLRRGPELWHPTCQENAETLPHPKKKQKRASEPGAPLQKRGRTATHGVAGTPGLRLRGGERQTTIQPRQVQDGRIALPQAHVVMASHSVSADQPKIAANQRLTPHFRVYGGCCSVA